MENESGVDAGVRSTGRAATARGRASRWKEGTMVIIATEELWNRIHAKLCDVNERQLSDEFFACQDSTLLDALKEMEAIIPVTTPKTLRVPHSLHAKMKNAIAKAEGW